MVFSSSRILPGHGCAMRISSAAGLISLIFFIMFSIVLMNEVLDETDNIFFPFPQIGHAYRQNRKPVVKILPGKAP